MKETDALSPESATSGSLRGTRSHELAVTSGVEESPSQNEPSESASKETDQKSARDERLDRTQTAHDEERSADGQTLATLSTAGPVHSVFTKNQKMFIVFMASFGGFFSPVSATIYFPALNALALDLGVTSTLINLTLTSYMVCSGPRGPLATSLSTRLSRFFKASRLRSLAILPTALAVVRHTRYVLSSTLGRTSAWPCKTIMRPFLYFGACKVLGAVAPSPSLVGSFQTSLQSRRGESIWGSLPLAHCWAPR